jgi:hypothetical protein
VGHVRLPRRGPAHGRRLGGERDTLLGFLADQRLTLQLKCADLDAEQLARRSVPPSNLSLLGLVRHLTGVEHSWFRRRMAGLDVPRLFDGDDDFDGAVADPGAVERAWATWRDEVAFAGEYVRGTADLGDTGKSGDPLREVLVHLIEEYARHNGHADFLRERIDGRVASSQATCATTSSMNRVSSPGRPKSATLTAQRAGPCSPK